jgi:nitrite reductase/ring-hydroxylating ferredoxin subunit
VAGCATAESTPQESNATASTTGQILLGLTSEVAVGSGTKFPVDSMLTVLVTQPKAGVYKAFSATCTHAGCIVNGVEESQIACGCHGARFDMDSGMAVAGPAKTALGKISVEIRGEEIWVTI